MRGVIYAVVVAVPLVVGLLRSREWLARLWAGRLGAALCVVVGVLVGIVPGLLAGCLLGEGASAAARHGLFALLALPLLAAGLWLIVRRPARGPVAEATGGRPAQGVPQGAIPPAVVQPPAVSSSPGRPAAVAQTAPGSTAKMASQGPAQGASAAAGKAEATAPSGDQSESTGNEGSAAPASHTPPRASPAAAALRALHAAHNEGQATAAPSEASASPTTVTECILSMSISCEEYMLRNLQEMARAPLPETQRDILTRLIEETDDKLARLRAASRRHHGEELVRATWNQLPEVKLPVVKPGATVAQIRDKALCQTRVMIDFYRTVASYAQRPSLKNLLVNLALDGQRHLSVIEQTG